MHGLGRIQCTSRRYQANKPLARHDWPPSTILVGLSTHYCYLEVPLRGTLKLPWKTYGMLTAIASRESCQTSSSAIVMLWTTIWGFSVLNMCQTSMNLLWHVSIFVCADESMFFQLPIYQRISSHAACPSRCSPQFPPMIWQSFCWDFIGIFGLGDIDRGDASPFLGRKNVKKHCNYHLIIGKALGIYGLSIDDINWSIDVAVRISGSRACK